MKFNYKLSRLCGSSYGPSASSSRRSDHPNIIFHPNGNSVYSPVGNRIQHLDLIHHSLQTLPFQTRSDICRIALHPEGRLLLAIDIDGYAVLANVNVNNSAQSQCCCVVLHRFKFKHPVRSIEFSPNGKYFAVGLVQRHVEVWFSPTYRKEYAPFVKHRTYTGLNGPVSSVHWSSDSSLLMGCSEDQTIRIWTVHALHGYVPCTLAGHRGPLVAAFFEYDATDPSKITGVYSVSSDGAIFTWKVTTLALQQENLETVQKTDTTMQFSDSAVQFFSGNPHSIVNNNMQSQAQCLLHQTWKLQKRHFVHPDHGSNNTNSTISSSSSSSVNIIVCAAFKGCTLVLGWSTGIFGLYEMPDCANIHTLSIGGSAAQGGISTVALNNTAEWIALGNASQNQLLVWEWRSETYVLKQASHGTNSKLTCMAYSPDSTVIATGGYDCKLKLWNTLSGFCFVTFADKHRGPITGIAFAKPTVVVSCSLDGTVRAFDLIRYRNFKTMTAPTRVQFICLAIDTSGEIVAAGTAETFDIYLWNLQTGKVLDVLSGHAGPVSSLHFNPRNGQLCSTSWDSTAKVWDIYKKDTVGESFTHSHDVVCAAVRPDGKVLCTGTLNGVLHFWRIGDGTLLHTIEGQRDIVGGRKINDRMTSDNNAASRYFTSVCFSADGTCVLAGGNSKYVCIYEVSQQMLLKKFQITLNRALDGVLDELNSKNLGDGGPIDALAPEDDGYGGNGNALRLPGAKQVDDAGSRKHRVEVLTTQVSFSSTGREWAAVSGEGLHIYSLDDDMLFDPIALTEAITPTAVQANLRAQKYGIALIMSMHLNEVSLVEQVLDCTPYTSIAHVVKSIGPQHLERLMIFVTNSMIDSPHVEFYVQWCLEILQCHGVYLQKHRHQYMRAFRTMSKVLQTKHDEWKTICDHNRYTLDFIVEQGQLLS